MIRLAHVSFFGLCFLNLSFALTACALHLESGLQTISDRLILVAIAMPVVCYLDTWKTIFRHLFFIPAMSVNVGIGLFVWRLFPK